MTAETELPEVDMTAAELALGLLEGDERAAALRRVVADPAFARDVDRWRADLALLAGQVTPVEAPAGLLARIDRALDSGVVVAASAAAPASLRRWRIATLVSSLAAAGLLGIIMLRPAPAPVRVPVNVPVEVRVPVAVRVPVPVPAPVPSETPTPTPAPSPSTPAPIVTTPPPAPSGPVLLAQITPERGRRQSVSAFYDPARGRLVVASAPLARRQRSAQLWLIPGDGRPRPLGLLAAENPSAFLLAPANRALMAAGATLAVSDEPRGGSTTGAPSGPVVATGALGAV